MTTKPRDPVAAWTKALSRDESARARRMLADVPRLSRVVEIGCGRGAKLDLLRGMGFTDVLGVERNPAVAGAARARGHQVVSPEDLPRTLDGRRAALLALGTRLLAIVDLAGRDDGAAVTGGQADRRRAALGVVDLAARRAVAAACAS